MSGFFVDECPMVAGYLLGFILTTSHSFVEFLEWFLSGLWAVLERS